MSPRRSTPGLRIAAFVFVAIWGLTTHGKYSASGDEPHYLLVSRSLVADRDLDLANNYAANDGRLVGHDGLVAGPHARPARGGRRHRRVVAADSQPQLPRVSGSGRVRRRVCAGVVDAAAVAVRARHLGDRLRARSPSVVPSQVFDLRH